MKSIVVAAAIAASALSIGASRAAQPAPRTPAAHAPRPGRHAPFAAGETLTYDVSWSAYLTAGILVTTVEKTSDGSSAAYSITAEGRTTPLLQRLYALSYKLDTLMDSDTLLPTRASTYSEEGSRHRLRITTFDRAAGKAHYEIRTTTVVKEDIVIAPGTQDALSAIYALRAMPLKTGGRVTMPVTDGGTTYSVGFDIGAPETVHAPAGAVSAWKIAASLIDRNGRAIGRNLAIWIANDDKRQPVKLQADLAFGGFTLTLREAR